MTNEISNMRYLSNKNLKSFGTIDINSNDSKVDNYVMEDFHLQLQNKYYIDNNNNNNDSYSVLSFSNKSNYTNNESIINTNDTIIQLASLNEQHILLNQKYIEAIKNIKLLKNEILQIKETTPSILLFYSILQVDTCIPKLQQLLLQLYNIKVALNNKEEEINNNNNNNYDIIADNVTIKRFQICIDCIPDINNLLVRYTHLYDQWKLQHDKLIQESQSLSPSYGYIHSIKNNTCPICFHELLLTSSSPSSLLLLSTPTRDNDSHTTPSNTALLSTLTSHLHSHENKNKTYYSKKSPIKSHIYSASAPSSRKNSFSSLSSTSPILSYSDKNHNNSHHNDVSPQLQSLHQYNNHISNNQDSGNDHNTTNSNCLQLILPPITTHNVGVKKKT